MIFIYAICEPKMWVFTVLWLIQISGLGFGLGLRFGGSESEPESGNLNEPLGKRPTLDSSTGYALMGIKEFLAYSL